MKIHINKTFITDSSLECEPGCYFLQTQSNHKYTDSALEKKATIIDVDECKNLLKIDKNIKIVGITGTNGKTTTATAIYSSLMKLGFKCGLSGTRGAFINGKNIDEKSLTTSPIFKTLYYLQKASEEKCDFFVMEVSSHAISQNRIEGLDFALKIFTNLSQDHLDYHKSIEEYANVKSSFFQDDSLKLINKDDKSIKFNEKNAYFYSLKRNSDFYSINYELKERIKALVKTNNEEIWLDLGLQGEFNLYNMLAVFGAISLLTDKNIKQISKALSEFNGVDGRMQIVSKKPLVIVDFAHTPDGIEKVLHALRHLSLVVIFGAGGDRDKTKRPKMGEIVQRYARVSIITSDNPRSERPQDIINDIYTGMNKENIIQEEDRKKAIKIGLSSLQDGEALVILGKGDEEYQEINGVKFPFSDKKIVEEILKEI
ncbi:UDP-N-acetylmuramoylalanyl-D-glutamate 2,6-diaminopimelate ligase [Campylobacter pinnipediorum subsp. pinnipediorum]|uniref:UDP-N-acetylmuramoyl-L-alanyl-D-glutamate--2, 6-diaminopimelate ligase n=2 Tax=Campylobacter pinnipediorum TaxID=1965231 RepID=UPI000995BAE6|nr:UDP-N-acetylmuramoyl-L-alanyl-D-glutamate--2,6-diaminopimelate ligase [Campylobacter pinnipediorum]AQW81240.1 UDP-N-acetylmuramoylalanyl-D-glutamate 2,6-diaminopimelate ligase [Campylobacter pinnipediorum subsp. pinnipediorum]